MKSKQPQNSLRWDAYSDQPHVITDREFKKRIYKAVRWDSFKMLATNVLMFPISFVFYWLSPVKKKQVNTRNFFGMSINLDKNPEETKALVDDLSCNNLLIRMPLHDIENLKAYVQFAEQFKSKDLLINILQDRRHVEDLSLLQNSLQQIFFAFKHLTNRFQIGNAINRKKWAFFSMDEYLAFYSVAQNLKDKQHPKLILLGSSVIDFEYYFTIRTLFNFHKVRFDQCSSLLYVDRRGAPENTQMGLDLIKKLRLLQAILRLSPKTSDDIVVTETNWPISHTAPYAPTGEKECVSLETHADFLVRYYLLALASGVVKNVYWHQLIAPGFGLIDNRNNQLIKYPAYHALKTMLSLLQGADFIHLELTSDLYCVSFTNQSKGNIDVLWTVSKSIVMPTDGKKVILRDGEVLKDQKEVTINPSPIYLLS